MSDKQRFLLGSALLAQELGGATCDLRANLIAKYLWENNRGIERIEVVSASNFSHTFVIVNRGGELSDSDTWGDAWIIDAWYGSPPSLQNVRRYRHPEQSGGAPGIARC